MGEATKAASVKSIKVLDRPASVTADLLVAVGVGAAAAVVIAILPLNWIPLIGPHLPGVGGGIVGALVYVRARNNNPLNL